VRRRPGGVRGRLLLLRPRSTDALRVPRLLGLHRGLRRQRRQRQGLRPALPGRPRRRLPVGRVRGVRGAHHVHGRLRDVRRRRHGPGVGLRDAGRVHGVHEGRGRLPGRGRRHRLALLLERAGAHLRVPRRGRLGVHDPRGRVDRVRERQPWGPRRRRLELLLRQRRELGRRRQDHLRRPLGRRRRVRLGLLHRGRSVRPLPRRDPGVPGRGRGPRVGLLVRRDGRGVLHERRQRRLPGQRRGRALPARDGALVRRSHLLLVGQAGLSGRLDLGPVSGGGRRSAGQLVRVSSLLLRPGLLRGRELRDPGRARAAHRVRVGRRAVRVLQQRRRL
jgi:hypothetical protein